MKKKIPSDLIRLLQKYDIAAPDGDKEYTIDEINELIDQVEKRIEQKKKRRLDVPNQGSRKLLAVLAHIVSKATTVAAINLAEMGIGAVPTKEGDNKRIAKDFTFDVVMHAVVGSGILTTLFTEIARTADTNEKNQKMIAESLKLLTFVMAIRAATKGNEDRMISLFDDFSKEIEKSIDIIIQGTSGELALKLQQAKMALQKGEINRFIKTCQGALDLLDITPELLEKNLKEIEEFANTFSEAMTAKNENPTTLTQQAM